MNLSISFSGGETSAYMTHMLLTRLRDQYDDIKVIFANTGQEHEKTLEFVHRCDEHFGFNTIWVEAEVYHGERRSCGAKIVTYETASRNGEPFVEVIKKYGIPNSKFKHCTRNLKTEPIHNYLRSIGWAKGTYLTAIGIRADEIDRMSSSAQDLGLIYPLVADFPATKPNINAWWDQQPFRLGLKGYQGNCTWCWKKSFRKHYTLLSENPEIYDFPDVMEREYGRRGAEFTSYLVDGRPLSRPDYRRVFFRGNKSTEELKAAFLREHNTFEPADDDAQIYHFNPELDLGAGCEESCEIYADEDA